ncbi:MAG TPA: hypothetical protein VN887_14735 [Candidatus Angelobacter sp.]|nr:hypothetical protein [Candidatus Angelobacter sp.]
MAGLNEGLASRVTMAGANISSARPLLQEFFYHAQRDAITLGDLLAGSLLTVVGS